MFQKIYFPLVFITLHIHSSQLDGSNTENSNRQLTPSSPSAPRPCRLASPPTSSPPTPLTSTSSLPSLTPPYTLTTDINDTSTVVSVATVIHPRHPLYRHHHRRHHRHNLLLRHLQSCDLAGSNAMNVKKNHENMFHHRRWFYVSSDVILV